MNFSKKQWKQLKKEDYQNCKIFTVLQELYRGPFRMEREIIDYVLIDKKKAYQLATKRAKFISTMIDRLDEIDPEQTRQIFNRFSYFMQDLIDILDAKNQNRIIRWQLTMKPVIKFVSSQLNKHLKPNTGEKQCHTSN